MKHIPSRINGALRVASLVALTLSVAACGDEEGSTDVVTNFAELQGTYTDDFDNTHAISAESWVTGTDIFHIQTVVDAEQYLVAQNDSSNAFNPDLFSRFEWAESDGVLYYCQSVFDASSEQAALASGGADAADLSTGCSGFAWSQLSPAE